MLRVLANDGMAASAVETLREMGHEVQTDKIAQEDLEQELDNFDVLIVRSATKVRRPLLEKLNRTKLIIRAGVGLDNIDLEAAKEMGITVNNTPAASSRSVAELAFGHALSMARFLHESNKAMPAQGKEDFKKLKKSYSKGVEMSGKTMGIIGFGRIGKELAKISLGAGMNVIAHDPWCQCNTIEMQIQDQTLTVEIPLKEKEEVLAASDFISVHTPKLDQPTIGAPELDQCKDGVFLINTSRGGVIDEDIITSGLDNGKIGGCALDVFENEPTPNEGLLQLERMSLTPHIGASTQEAQIKIGDIIVDLISAFAASK